MTSESHGLLQASPISPTTGGTFENTAISTSQEDTAINFAAFEHKDPLLTDDACATTSQGAMFQIDSEGDLVDNSAYQQNVTMSNGDNNITSTEDDSYVHGEGEYSQVPLWKRAYCRLRGIDPLTMQRRQKPAKKLGLAMGVLIPNILSIFGVILFLRLGMIVGQCGVWIAILMFSFGYFVVLMTTLSLSAISTNGTVRGGGAYFLISRSLGPELGGSVGFVFFLGNIAAGSLYIVGFSDAMAQAFPDLLPQGRWWKFLYGTIALVILTLISLMGAGLFAKTSLLIFVVLMTSLGMSMISFVMQSPDKVSGFTGASWRTGFGNFAPSFVASVESPMLSYSQVFGILFPSVTGIMAGVNMSGDLANPAKSIPKGTLMAVGGTYVVYISLILILGFTVLKETLINNYSIMSDVSLIPIVVSMGIWAATLSSALSSVIGGSRILQALSRDKLVPFLGFFGKGFGKNDEPRIAVIITYIAIQFCILIGDLNIIAPLQTMMFLLLYAFVNFACVALSVTGAPNWRPLFKQYSWLTALIGAVLCVIIMFVVSPINAGIAIGLQLILIIIIHFYAPSQQWGDISQALIFHQVRKYLLRLDEKKEHVKYWRLQALLCIANPRSSYPLIQFINNLKKGGLYVVGNVKVGDFDSNLEVIKQERAAWYEFIAESKFKAFPEVVVASSVRQGIQNLMMTSGLGGMRINTMFLGFYESAKVPQQSSEIKRGKKSISLFSPLREKGVSELSVDEYVSIIKDAHSLNKNVILARGFDALDQRLLQPKNIVKKLARIKIRHIDLWPLRYTNSADSIEPSVALTLQLGHIINLVDVWSKFHKLRLCSIVFDGGSAHDEEKRLKTLLQVCRIRAEILVVALQESDFYMFDVNAKHDLESGMSREHFLADLYHKLSARDQKILINNIIKQHSDRTSVIFMTLPKPPLENTMDTSYTKYLEDLDLLSAELPPTMMVHSTSNVIALEV